MHMYAMMDYRHLCGCLWHKCVFVLYHYCFVSNSLSRKFLCLSVLLFVFVIPVFLVLNLFIPCTSI